MTVLVEALHFGEGLFYFHGMNTARLRIFVLLSLLAAGLGAQIVNVEDLRLKEDTVKWRFREQFDFDLVKNQRTLYTLDNSLGLRYRRDAHQVLFLNHIQASISSGQSFEQSGFVHLRYQFSGKAWLDWEYFQQIQLDQPLRIEFRYLNGFGPRLALVEQENIKLHFGPLLMYEIDQERETGIRHFDWRASAYLAFTWSIKDKFKWHTVTYYQPRLEAVEDFRIALQNQWEVNVFKGLAFALRFGLNYDAFPVQLANIPQLTYKLENGIVLRF